MPCLVLPPPFLWFPGFSSNSLWVLLPQPISQVLGFQGFHPEPSSLILLHRLSGWSHPRPQPQPLSVDFLTHLSDSHPSPDHSFVYTAASGTFLPGGSIAPQTQHHHHANPEASANLLMGLYCEFYFLSLSWLSPSFLSPFCSLHFRLSSYLPCNTELTSWLPLHSS